MMRKAAMMILIAMCSGCSWMFPYEDEFACPKKDYMGKCISSMNAYEEATTGESKGKWAKPASERDDDDEDEGDQKESAPKKSPNDGYMHYVQENYRQQASLLEQPVTPLVKAPAVLEILILAHPSEDERTLWGHRYVHVILEDSSFILGDYLKKKMIPVDSMF